jgi:hypothetical protein
MTNSSSSNATSPGALIHEAMGIIMDRFNIDEAHALEVLRRMSQNTSTPMCEVAEQIINHEVPVQAVRGLEEAVRGFARQLTMHQRPPL